MRNPQVNTSNICLTETDEAVTSISTCQFVPQPIDNKIHFIPNRLFVSGFPGTTTKKQLSDSFRRFGEIISCNIVYSKNESKCYGFVTYRSVSSADAVLSVSSRGRKFVVNGLCLKIKKAQFKPRKNALQKQILVQCDKGMAYFLHAANGSTCQLLPSLVPVMPQSSPALHSMPALPAYSVQYMNHGMPLPPQKQIMLPVNNPANFYKLYLKKPF